MYTLGYESPHRFGDRTLSKGLTGYDVRELQLRLNALGYNASGADGSFGPKTDEDVRYFQTVHGLQSDGVVGPITEEALNITYKTFGSKILRSSTAASYPRAVRELQKRLANWGYYGGPWNGTWNSETESAVRKYQRAQGLSDDGTVGHMTMSRMLNFTYASPLRDKYKTRPIPTLFKELVCKWSYSKGLNPVQVCAMVEKESTWYRETQNHPTNPITYGLLQLTCSTAKGEGYTGTCPGNKGTQSDPAGGTGLFHADTNLQYGSSYIYRFFEGADRQWPTIQNTIAAHNMGCGCEAEWYLPDVLAMIRYYGNYNNG